MTTTTTTTKATKTRRMRTMVPIRTIAQLLLSIVRLRDTILLLL
ncbi:hypothetical protein M0804_014366 [Polistes exclamans]|nr:hypothetical protein M0804_014369 [Polistes exclamans]KAI4475335.1 hypothetical protein M0804_014366 [Polistes exclamans]